MSKLDLITNETIDLAIVQGATYEKLILRIEGDYTLATFKAEIRNNILESGGDLLASFSFQQIAYDATEDKTTVVPVLSATQTADIPFTRFDGVGEPSRRNCWVWDMEAVFFDRVIKVIQLSLVQVTAEATD
jgi:hypothetical protein